MATLLVVNYALINLNNIDSDVYLALFRVFEPDALPDISISTMRKIVVILSSNMPSKIK